MERVADLPGPIVFRRDVHRDEHGVYVESWHERRYGHAGLLARFVQVDCSRSRRDVLRGLHFQNPHPQGKLVSVIRGAILYVAVDIRVGSPTLGRWMGVRLSAENGLQLWVPPDFAHGFVTLTDEADILCHCTDFHRPEAERTLLWNDRELGIEWSVERPLLAPKDAAGETLHALREADGLPFYRAGDRPPPDRRIPTGTRVPLVR